MTEKSTEQQRQLDKVAPSASVTNKWTGPGRSPLPLSVGAYLMAAQPHLLEGGQTEEAQDQADQQEGGRASDVVGRESISSAAAFLCLRPRLFHVALCPFI